MPSQLIGIELCSAPVSSTYTRERRPTLHPAASDHRTPYPPPPLPLPPTSHLRAAAPIARLEVAPLSLYLHPFPLFSLFLFLTVLDFATMNEKPPTTRYSGSFDHRGNSSRHDDASCRRSPRTCRRPPCSLFFSVVSGREQERTSERTRPRREIARATPGAQRCRRAGFFRPGKKRDVTAFAAFALAGGL